MHAYIHTHIHIDDPAAVAEALAAKAAGREHWLVHHEEERLNGTGTLLTLPGAPWIAAYHCTAPDVRDTSLCAYNMIGFFFLIFFLWIAERKTYHRAAADVRDTTLCACKYDFFFLSRYRAMRIHCDRFFVIMFFFCGS
jgi:hypothetical protein